MRIIEKLEVFHFRNIAQSVFHPHKQLNFFFGKNGQGKTSILEALGYLAHLKSFRNSQYEQVIQYHRSRSVVSCLLTSAVDAEWRTDLKIEMTAQPLQKRAWINGKPCLRSTQYLEKKFDPHPSGFHAVIFNPNDHDLVRGEPCIRRSYLDRLLSSESMDYFLSLQKYQKALQQRNVLLKTEQTSSEVWKSFTETLCQYGSWMIWKRLEWFQEVFPEFLNIFHKIVPHSHKSIQLGYVSRLIPDAFSPITKGIPSLSEVRVAFLKRLDEVRDIEKKTQYSLVGPHREDWGFYFEKRSVQGQASQGEVRSLLLAFKLAEVALFRKKMGYLPVFLLDDFSSELDHERRSFLLQYLVQEEMQSFVTSTEDLGYPMGKKFRVQGGQVIEERCME